MQFLVVSENRPDADPAAMLPHLAGEAAQAWRHYLDGFIRQAYFTVPPAAPGAVFVVEADSLDDARDRVATMPLAQAGLVDFDVTPIGPFAPWAALIGAGVSG